MEQAQTFDKEIDELYHAMWKGLFLYANTELKNPDLAVEAVQDTFRIACSKPTAMLTSENPEGWLMNTLKNVVRDIKRAEAKQTTLMMRMRSTKISNDNSGEEGDVHIRLMCQQALKEDEYALVDMVIFQQHTLRDVARELDISLEACKKRFQRTREKLKNFLEK